MLKNNGDGKADTGENSKDHGNETHCRILCVPVPEDDGEVREVVTLADRLRVNGFAPVVPAPSPVPVQGVKIPEDTFRQKLVCLKT